MGCGVPERGLMAAGVTACVTRFVWVHTERSSVPVRKNLLFH